MTRKLTNRIVVVLCTFIGLVAASPAFADNVKAISVYAQGQIVSQDPSGFPVVCQVTDVTGIATVIGRFTGELRECVNVYTGQYEGTGVFTTTNGDTLSTSYAGLVGPPDATGTAAFFEHHTLTGGTGKYVGAEGTLDVQGTADANLAISITGTGFLIK